MKKYSKPVLEVISVKSQDILAGSIGSVQGEYDGTLQIKAKSRNDYYYDDENEDDF